MRLIIKFVFTIFILISLISCGGGGDSGGTERLRTVQVFTPTLSKTVIDADVATWRDVNGDGRICDFLNDTYTINPDLVDVTFSITALPNLPSGLNPSPVRVESVEIIFTPATSTAPSIPTQYRALGVLVLPGTSSTFTLDVVSQNVKISLTDKLICSDIIYYYYVQLKFRVIEVNTGKTETVQTALTLKLADFAETQ